MGSETPKYSIYLSTFRDRSPSNIRLPKFVNVKKGTHVLFDPWNRLVNVTPYPLVQ